MPANHRLFGQAVNNLFGNPFMMPMTAEPDFTEQFSQRLAELGLKGVVLNVGLNFVDVAFVFHGIVLSTDVLNRESKQAVKTSRAGKAVMVPISVVIMKFGLQCRNASGLYLVVHIARF